ncbi:MAG: SGNH/GDSL hydrolase family protein [bacterium]
MLALLLTLAVDVRPAGMEALIQRADARAAGLGVLRGKRILMIGDSMVNSGINAHLRPYFKKHGVISYVTISWASSTTVTWSQSPKLRQYLWKWDPDVVFVCIGTNEILIPYPKMRIRAIRAILGKMGRRRSVYWIGPPAWKRDRGFIAVLRGQLPQGHFFDSAKLRIPRMPDGYHPSVVGAKIWGTAIWRWYAALLAAPPPRRSNPPPRRSTRAGR